MVWYVASVILAVEVEGIEQDEYPVFENFYLIEAENRTLAFANAEALGREEALANQGVTFKDRSARFKFIGIRKIRSVYNPSPLSLNEDRPTSGTELSHSYFELKCKSDLDKFASGKSVTVQYVDDDDPEGA